MSPRYFDVTPSLWKRMLSKYPRLVVFSGPLTHMGHKCNVQKWTDSQALIFVFALVIPFFPGPRKALAFCRRSIVDSTHPWAYFNTIPFQEMFIPAVDPIASLNRDLTTTVDRSHQWCRAQQQTIAHDTSQYWFEVYPPLKSCFQFLMVSANSMVCFRYVVMDRDI